MRHALAPFVVTGRSCGYGHSDLKVIRVVHEKDLRQRVGGRAPGENLLPRAGLQDGETADDVDGDRHVVDSRVARRQAAGGRGKVVAAVGVDRHGLRRHARRRRHAAGAHPHDTEVEVARLPQPVAAATCGLAAHGPGRVQRLRMPLLRQVGARQPGLGLLEIAQVPAAASSLLARPPLAALAQAQQRNAAPEEDQDAAEDQKRHASREEREGDHPETAGRRQEGR